MSARPASCEREPEPGVGWRLWRPLEALREFHKCPLVGPVSDQNPRGSFRSIGAMC